MSGVGLITWVVEDQPQLIDDLADVGFRTFFLSFGDPGGLLPRIQKVGGRAICQVQTVTEAKRAATLGADAIVAQGTEAGGHGCNNDTADKLAEAVLAEVTPTPVLVAGAKTSGADLAEAWRAGAGGIVVGTAMYATTEALDTAAAKQRLITATANETVRTTVFDLVRGPEWPAGYNGRSLPNDTTRLWHNQEEALRSGLDDARAEYQQAVATQDLDRRVVWAGTAVDQIESIERAADLVRRIIIDAGRGETGT